MKTVMFLGILIGVLLCALLYMWTRNSGSTITSSHIKTIEKNAYDTIKTLCQDNVEYIIVNGNGTTAIAAVEIDGRPKKCKY